MEKRFIGHCSNNRYLCNVGLIEDSFCHHMISISEFPQWKEYIKEIELFNFCPICGRKLNYKYIQEQIKNQFE